MRVKGKKDATIHSIKELQECRRLALVAIPKLLSRLEEQHTTTDQCNLFGYVAAYLASLYGHRLGVFLNMTDVQVSQAVHGPEKNDYLLKMEDHKTNESFGTAKMLLSDQEYGWLMDIIHLKTNPDKNLTKYVKRVWSEMHLEGEATFTSLRSAVATFARDRHGEDSQDRKSMARLMCHDTATSDKFYTMDLTMEQARKGRLLFEEAQKEGEESVTGTNKRKKDGEEGRKKKSEQESTPPQSDVIKRRVMYSY
ncbi:Upstream activation factor subunit spp27 [Dissostichus eleginoides]|uniref:Upstream activation factor subunit spp27 n=1 Tax=Dissostichus eleginoides TaxID=100907 RepID=A0AAD9B6I0_DISEL|nr:Upstream activation factor subunit spp27 [Dissostichus eleginoides]